MCKTNNLQLKQTDQQYVSETNQNKTTLNLKHNISQAQLSFKHHKQS